MKKHFFFVYCGAIFDMERKKQPPVLRKFNDCEVVFLTTVYPTSATGIHGYKGETVVKEHREAPYFVAESTLKN